MRFFANANYPFLSWRRKSFTVAAIILGICVLSMIYNAVARGSWLNYGVDFTGGTLVQVDFEDQVDAEAVRAVGPEWQITRFGDTSSSEYVIRVPTFEEDLGVDPAAAVAERLSAAFGEDSFTIVRTEAVGPRVGGELQRKALYAILISFLCTLAYLAWRFEWRFGVAAVITTAHDIVFALGFAAITQMEISTSTIAAFLTIVGYSLNDTIVVFDRIRENFEKRTQYKSVEELMDRAINETLPRTILTSLTTTATLLALYIFGGEVIRDFALILIVGVVLGTFSTIFIAAPALFEIERKWPRKVVKGGRAGSARRPRPVHV